MMKHIEKIHSFETVVFTVLSFLLAAVAVHYFSVWMGWEYGQWSTGSILCVFAGVSVLFGSLFCGIYDLIEHIRRASFSAKTRDKRKSAVIISFPGQR